jgi:hypothetical protein
VTNINVVKLVSAKGIVPAYKHALKCDKSTILIELAEKVREVDCTPMTGQVRLGESGGAPPYSVE